MPQELSSRDVDELVRAARHRKTLLPPPAASQRQVTPFRLSRRTEVSASDLLALGQPHKSFAASVARYLSAFLRCALEVTEEPPELVAYGEFLERAGGPCYFAQLKLRSPDAAMLLSLDLTVACSIIDLLLGGDGKAEALGRDLTEIEGQVLDGIPRLVTREFRAAWQGVLDLDTRFERMLGRPQAARLMSSSEQVVILPCQVRMMEAVEGRIAIVLPATVWTRLLRRIAEQTRTPEPRSSPEHSARMQERVLRCAFNVTMELPPSALSGRDLLMLEAGQTLALPHRVRDPVWIRVAEQQMFLAHPARSGNQRAGVLKGRLNAPNPPSEEA